MNKFVQRNWITFIIYCDQIIPKPIFKQPNPCLRWLFFLLPIVSFPSRPNLLIMLHVCLVLQVVYSGKELNHPFGISHYRNFIFWTEYMNASVFQLELSTGDVTLLRSERPPLFGLRVYDAQSQQGWLPSLHLVLIQCRWAVAEPNRESGCFCTGNKTSLSWVFRHLYPLYLLS